MKKIFILGSVNTDFVINAPYIPQKGETLAGDGFFTARGGKGANQAVAAARLGGNVSFCGAIGDDVFGEDAIASLKKEGICVDHVKKISNTSTGTAIIIICNGDNRIILDSGANAHINNDVVDAFLENAERGDIFLAQLENPVTVVAHGLQKAKEKGMYVVLNPAPANKEILPFIKYCDLLVPNDSECKLLGGEKELLKSVNTLLITLGDKGYAIIDKICKKESPCIKIKPVDTTAAGDTLCGGLVASLAEGKSLDESAKYGSLAATIACTKKGAQPSIPYKQQVAEYKQ